MKRLFQSLASIALAATLGSGSAFANPHNGKGMGHSMSGHPAMMGSPMYRNHRYGNDKARCRDARGRFMKLHHGRCLAK